MVKVNRPFISLIVATYNWPEALQACLLSISRQVMLPAEVIIADDGSDERTRQMIAAISASFPVPVRHIWQEDAGFRKSLILNKAIAHSNSEYIIQIDGDVILHAHFIADHVACREPATFVRGSRAWLTPAKTTAILTDAGTRLHALSKGVRHRLNAVRLPIFRSMGEKKKMESRNVRGSNLAYWKQDIVMVNGYNNDLQGWGHEDEELAVRFINNAIIKKVVKLSAVQFHLYHKESDKLNEPFHSAVLSDMISRKAKVCSNGLHQL